MEQEESSGKKSHIQKIIDNISANKAASNSIFILLLLLYVFAAFAVNHTAKSSEVVTLWNTRIPVSSFAGVISSIANISLIFLVVFYRKKGFYTCIIFYIIHFVKFLFTIFFLHNIPSLPGFFASLVTIIASIVIYQRNKKIENYQLTLQDIALTDSLTGLASKLAFLEYKNALKKKGEKFTIVSIDLNNFKSVNYSLGRNTGNKVLQEIGSRWKNFVLNKRSGTHNFICRLNGDEFALIIHTYNSEEEVIETIKEYQSLLEEKISIDGYDFYITASFGYSEYPTDSDSSDTVFSYSEAALYDVKKTNNSNKIARYSPGLLKTERTLEIETLIRAALVNDSIYFQMQPQYDMDHRLRGFEVLARMKDQNGNNVSPGEFIPVAEKVGLIDQVDGTVFKKAAEFFGKLIKNHQSDIVLSINISVRHLMKADFLNEVKAIIKSTGIPEKQLEFEITESIMMDSADKALQCIREIKNMGVQVAIDDFGTGYSSLSYLYKYPANLLKIDKSFIDEMSTGEASKQYVAAIIAIGHTMGFKVISEGVEEESQLETLRNIGCDYIQGYIWGKPVLPQQAEILLNS
ncbi:MAG: bifunctional diguanylate cyclase/phosphodiesterase [Treponema sp.]|nr:bifunctional diguanylate cyclase/phosphodiesterase [Treponema sp.]